jgi:hypothetical protein
MSFFRITPARYAAPVTSPELLQAYLADQDVPCPGCGYNLRGLTSGVCPECRHQLLLRVDLAEPAIGALIAALAPLLIMAGASALLVVFVVVISTIDSPPPRGIALAVLWTPLVFVVSFGAAAWRLGQRKARQRFRLLSRAAKVRRIAGYWALSAATFALWLAWLIDVVD